MRRKDTLHEKILLFCYALVDHIIFADTPL
jgi:hypothetical protein